MINLFERIKKFFSRKKIIKVFIFSLSFLFLFFFLWNSIYGSWWRVWPQNIRSLIALNRLAILVYEEPYCRSDCYFERYYYSEEILASLDRENFLDRLRKIILDEEENMRWRLEALKLIANYHDYESLSIMEDLQNYLDDDSGNFRIKKAIARYFQDKLYFDQYYEYYKKIVFDDSLFFLLRILALENLSSLDVSQADLYFSVLKKEKNENFKIELLRALASDQGRFDLKQKELFRLLDNIIRDSNSSFSSRRLALFILSDFLISDLDNDIYQLFEKIIFSGEIDNFTRYLAINIFNDYSFEFYSSPKISQDDWDWYYSQK
jgi:hypothetical protein